MICHHAPRDAMALSFPTGGSNSSSANMKVANDASIFNPGTHLLSIPKEKMDQIRSTMMCHEALFKEQVQALHKLYEIQKRAMQETRKRAYSQGSLALTSRSLSPVHSSRSVEYREQCQGTEKASFGSNLGSIQQHQFLQSNIIFTSANSKLHEQKGSNNRSPVSTNPISFSQGLKTLITLTPIQYDSKKFGSCNQGNSPLESNSNSGKQNSYSSALSSQTSDDSGHENRNTSGHGSNCIGQSADICREGHNNIFTIKGSHSSCFDCSEPDQRNQGTVEGFQSETEGKSQLIKDGMEPSLSSSAPNSENKHKNQSTYSNGSFDIPESQQGPGVVTESNEDTTNEETVEEACESIAAKILLSFAPCRSCGDAKSKVINPLMEA